ncbi:hypothetical protein BDZ45DRAFT_574182, partial [Acephala macrosclerotiorum]
ESIGILELYPEDESGEVACRLNILNLMSVPVCKAISYVWGDPLVKVDVHCDGKIIHVTPSLKVALKHLRPRSVVRRLWADAIRINQEDLEERSQQVGIMSTIYSKARRILI